MMPIFKIHCIVEIERIGSEAIWCSKCGGPIVSTIGNPFLRCRTSFRSRHSTVHRMVCHVRLKIDGCRYVFWHRACIENFGDLFLKERKCGRVGRSCLTYSWAMLVLQVVQLWSCKSARSLMRRGRGTDYKMLWSNLWKLERWTSAWSSIFVFSFF